VENGGQPLLIVDNYVENVENYPFGKLQTRFSVENLLKGLKNGPKKGGKPAPCRGCFFFKRRRKALLF